jgi:hypothetical protein
MDGVSGQYNNNSNGAGIMPTIEKTRSRVSERSWVKAQRKEAAKAYKTPNRVSRYYSTVYWASHYRDRMAEYRASMLRSTDPRSIEIYFQAYLWNRINYKQEIRGFNDWTDVLPLP